MKHIDLTTKLALFNVDCAEAQILNSHPRRPVHSADANRWSSPVTALQAAGGMTLRAAWLLERHLQVPGRLTDASPVDAEARRDAAASQASRFTAPRPSRFSSSAMARHAQDRPQAPIMLPNERLTGDPAASPEHGPPPSDGGDP